MHRREARTVALEEAAASMEAAAVKEWLDSDKTLHAMRDHPYHGVSIMGGGWGSKLDTDQRRQQWQSSWAGEYQPIRSQIC